jgi:hypothetical protein
LPASVEFALGVLLAPVFCAAAETTCVGKLAAAEVAIVASP